MTGVSLQFKVAGAKDGNSAPDNWRRYVCVPCVGAQNIRAIWECQHCALKGNTVVVCLP